jgi:hypothetical protein
MSQTSIVQAPLRVPRSVGIHPGLLRGIEFDFTLIVVNAVWALLAGIAVVSNPTLFIPILVFDMWLLGYQHVVATYTRLVFDSESFGRYRFLASGLPVIVAVGTFGAAWSIGPWIVASTYLYWQWFHYTRQSYGISRMYLRKIDAVPDRHDPILFGVTYLLPLWGILRRSAQQPPTFLSLELVTIPVPSPVLFAVAVAAIACLVLWVPREIAAIRRDARRIPYAAYMVSHVVIFATGYLLIENIDTGWLVLNIWHNLQYLLVVWMHNTNRFKSGIDPHHRFLSTISQPQNVRKYIAVCLLASTLLYVSIQMGLGLLSSQVLSLSFAVYMTINFHHYIVDAIIWRRKRLAPSPRPEPLPV